MNTETGTFHTHEDYQKVFGNTVEDAVKIGKAKLFTLGEIITVKGEPFLLQAITSDCLILVPKARADSLR